MKICAIEKNPPICALEQWKRSLKYRFMNGITSPAPMPISSALNAIGTSRRRSARVTGSVACESGCSSIAQVFTAAAALLGPALARRFGKLRTAVASELLSLPFLVTLGAERRLGIAVGSFWMRATFMQAATPLLQTFIMEAMPRQLRARATSLINLVWNMGWAASTVLAGRVIERLGFAMPFYITAALYAIAASTFWLAFRNVRESDGDVRLSEEAKGRRGGEIAPD